MVRSSKGNSEEANEVAGMRNIDGFRTNQEQKRTAKTPRPEREKKGKRKKNAGVYEVLEATTPGRTRTCMNPLRRRVHYPLCYGGNPKTY
jgi:hypothetical protein